MWFETPRSAPDWSRAIKHLKRDPVLRDVIHRVGPCTLHPRRDYFVVLCKSIFTQQISTVVATTLFGRFRELFPMRRPTPPLVVKALTNGNTDALRGCGLSRQKHSYLLGLAEHFKAGKVPTKRFARMTDEQIIESLVEVKGIGRWTAEMFLIFVLNRPDVWPVDDLGLREGVKKGLKLKDRPGAAELREIGERWRPYRTIATWYLWRSLAAPKPVPPLAASRTKTRLHAPIREAASEGPVARAFPSTPGVLHNYVDCRAARRDNAGGSFLT